MNESHPITDIGAIKEAVRRFVIDNLLFGDPQFNLEDHMSFLEGGVIDSIGVMELATFVSTRFGLELEPGEITPDNFDSVQRLAEFVVRKKAASVPVP
jgi:acyl carrier protein